MQCVHVLIELLLLLAAASPGARASSRALTGDSWERPSAANLIVGASTASDSQLMGASTASDPPCPKLEGRKPSALDAVCRCDVRSVASTLDALGPTVGELHAALADVDLMIVGNSVSRHVWFSLRHLLSGQNDSARCADTAAIVGCGETIAVRPADYRRDEKRECAPDKGSPPCAATIGRTRLFAHWLGDQNWGANYSADADIASNALRLRAEADERARAARRERRALVVLLFNGVELAARLPPARDFDAAAERKARALVGAVRACDGARLVVRLATPLCENPKPGRHRRVNPHDQSLAQLNTRLAADNARLRAAALAPGNGTTARAAVVDSTIAGDVEVAGTAAGAACQCYDDFVHHHRLAFAHIAQIMAQVTEVLAPVS